MLVTGGGVQHSSGGPLLLGFGDRWSATARDRQIGMEEVKKEGQNVYMALNIRHPEADRLNRELSSVTGESLTDSVVGALRLRLAQERRRPAPLKATEIISEARDRLAKLKVLDDLSADEIQSDNKPLSLICAIFRQQFNRSDQAERISGLGASAGGGVSPRLHARSARRSGGPW